MKRLGLKRHSAPLAKWLCMGLLFLLAAGPLFLLGLLYLGFPPVIGNLAAARAMERYAAHVYPDWEAERHWAGYDLVGDGYYLSFSHGGEARSLEYGPWGRLVADKGREKALREELDIDGAIRRAGLWIPDQSITMWGARWSPQMPDEAIISVDVQFYGSADEPVPDETAMRERMADRAMAAYEALAAHCPIHRFSVHYHHRGTQSKQGGMLWNKITVELPQGEPLTREHILTGRLVTN